METDTRGMLDQWPFQPVHSPFAFAPCRFTGARFALPITKPLFLPARSVGDAPRCGRGSVWPTHSPFLLESGGAPT